MTRDNISKNNFRIVAFDFWDTIVHRDCHPEEVLFEWAKKCSAFLRYQVLPSELYNVRKIVERDGKKNTGKEELSYDELLLGIYNRLNCDCKFDDFLQYSLSCETEIELQHSIIDVDIVNLLEEYDSDNCDMYIISDFYIGKNLFNKVLQYLKISKYFKEIYVSSDISLRKSTGNLYKYFIKDIGCEPSDILMIGDNKHSDFEIPRNLGINAIHKEYDCGEQNIYNKGQITRLCEKIVFESPIKNPLNGYLPEILYFISNLHKYAVENQINRMFFLSREGLFMQKLFDVYQCSTGEKLVETNYFYASRKSVFIASLDDIEKETFSVFSRQYKKITVENFLISLAFDETEINLVLDDIVKVNINRNDYIELKEKNTVFCTLKKSLAFRKIYDRRRLDSKESFLKYFETFNVNIEETSPLTFVDIGWKGTIQDCIQKIIGKDVKIRGIYLGLLGKNYGIQDASHKIGILFDDQIMQGKYLKILEKRHIILEHIFAANHGPVVGYAISGSDCIPLIDNDDNQLALSHFLDEYQKDMIGTFKCILKIYKHSMYLPFEHRNFIFKMIYWNRYVYYYQISEFLKILESLAVENFGEVCMSAVVKNNNCTKTFHKNSNMFEVNIFRKYINLIRFYLNYFRFVMLSKER